MAGPIHYEIYIRKTVPSPWTLLIATESRQHAMETAEDQMRDRLVAAVRVTKETLDPETMAFSSLTVLTLGAPEERKKRKVEEDRAAPACTGPMDLYSPHARALIGRVLEDWLARNGVTPFELLHNPDLAERLDASGVELQHAIQKVAVPESQATGQDVHALIRHYQKLVEGAGQRLAKAGRSGAFPDLDREAAAQVAHRLSGQPDRAFLMGGAVAEALDGLRGARERLTRLMDIVDAAPAEGPPRALVLVAVEQVCAEMLSRRAVLAEVLGPELDHGSGLAAVVRMVAPREVETLAARDPRLASAMPAVEGPAARLADHLAAGEFKVLAGALARMVVRQLLSPRRLRPGDPEGEIEILRVLAMTLTAAAGRLLTLDEVQSAFVERSRILVNADFVQSYLASCRTVLDEAEHLARLCENVAGGANKRAAARWLSACVTALRFEAEMRQGAHVGNVAAQRLAALARLQRSVRAARLGEAEEMKILDAVGVVGGAVEGDARLVSQIARAEVSPAQKLGALLRLAARETAPSGPAAERARAEALRILRDPQAQAALAENPELLAGFKTLMRTAGVAPA